jgi:hypothetical protein
VARYGPKQTKNGVLLNVPSFCFTIIVSLTPVRIAFSSKELQIILLASTHDRKKFIVKNIKNEKIIRFMTVKVKLRFFKGFILMV